MSQQVRSEALDALRGVSVMGMLLSLNPGAWDHALHMCLRSVCQDDLALLVLNQVVEQPAAVGRDTEPWSGRIRSLCEGHQNPVRMRHEVIQVDSNRFHPGVGVVDA